MPEVIDFLAESLKPMTVPLLDVNAQNIPLEAELKSAFDRVLRSGQFILGPEIERFERAIAHMVGAKHALGVASGTDAILLALMALEIGPGDEVICPSFTFFATAGCIARVGATPVFADSCPTCFNLDVADVAARVTQRTKAIIPVHLFGQAAAMNEVLTLARQHGLRVIEDGAQALGARYQGQQVGTIGDFGTFSFFPSKNLGGFGDSGMLVCNDDALAEKARILRTHGSKPKYYHKYIGGNFRMDPLQAALLAVKLPYYAHYTLRRQANAAFYSEQLSKSRGVTAASPESCRCTVASRAALGTSRASNDDTPTPSNHARIVLPVARPGNDHIWNQYTLRVLGDSQRDRLKAHLTAAGIGTEIYYPVPMHEQDCFARVPRGTTPSPSTASILAKQSLSIPVYPELTQEQLGRVTQAVAQFQA